MQNETCKNKDFKFLAELAVYQKTELFPCQWSEKEKLLFESIKEIFEFMGLKKVSEFVFYRKNH